MIKNSIIKPLTDAQKLEFDEVSFIIYAVTHINAASKLIAWNTIHEIAIFQNICVHAVELSLKAIVVKQGNNPKDFSHKILDLKEFTEGSGLKFSTEDNARFILINDAIYNQEFRYPKGMIFTNLGDDLLIWSKLVLVKCAQLIGGNATSQIPHFWWTELAYLTR
jgi:hypothetical protein